MAVTLHNKMLVKSILDPFSVTSDGKTGDYVDYNGWNYATIVCQGGLVATGDSADTLAFQVHRIDDIAASAAAASDHVDITAAIATLGPTADTTAELGIELIHLDFTQHSLDNGCLAVTADASLGGVIAGSASIIFYGKNGALSDSDMTVTVAASS